MACCCPALVRPALLSRVNTRFAWAAAPPGTACRWCKSGNAGGGAADSSGSSILGSRRPSSTAASAAVKDDLLRGVDAEHRDAVARMVELAQRAANSWSVAHTDFYAPPVVADAMMVLQVGCCRLAHVLAPQRCCMHWVLSMARPAPVAANSFESATSPFGAFSVWPM
jgi:hypothetical protein